VQLADVAFVCQIREEVASIAASCGACNDSSHVTGS
jgi:hypothetical protein